MRIYNVNNNDKSPILILITVIHQRQMVLGGTCQAMGTLKRLLLLAEESHVYYPQRSTDDQTGRVRVHHTGYPKNHGHRKPHPIYVLKCEQ